MKNSSDTIGNRSHVLPVCGAVPQPLRYRVPPFLWYNFKIVEIIRDCVSYKGHVINITKTVRLLWLVAVHPLAHK
jgi:hypothetical protein